MEKKRGLISFILVFTFVILSLSLISSTTCSVVPVASCPAVNTVMKLSAITNAHGEIYSQTNYPYALCCFGMKYFTAADNSSMHTCLTGNTNAVLELSAITNAHAEILAEDYYTTNVCFGQFRCSSGSGSCPSNYDIPVASLSATTNAHLGSFATYNIKICCDDTDAICGNNVIEDGEDCEGSNLNGATCASVLLNPAAVGTLSCTPPPTGCKYDASGCCLPETNTAFCTRLGRECGSLTALDNCGTSRTVASCGTCTLPETCQSGTCVCTPETDAQFCSRLGVTCGSLTAADNCGNTRTVASCGTCSDSSLCTTDTCSSGSCVYTPITCNDGNICTGDSCNALIGCVYSPLTGTSCTSDGNPCTLDLCSAGSCTHPTISNCCTLNSQCNDNNACTAPDTCNLVTNTCSNPVISSCTSGDGCCPSGCTISTDSDCTTCTVATQQADCNDGNSCTSQVCSSGLCTNPPITSCTGGDGCCPSGCNAVTDSDCTATCGNGVREPGEECDGLQLNGATCITEMGAGYTGSLTCYAAGTPDECTYNTAGCIPPCILTDARWNPIGSVLNGTPVQLIITGNDCSGKSIRLDIFEKDGFLNSPDSITTGTPAGRNPSNALFPAGGTLTVNWNSWYIDDTDGGQTNPPEYFFNATVVGGTSSVQSLNSDDNDPNLLTVTLPVVCTDTCLSLGYTCGTYDICGVSTDCGVCPPTCTLLTANWNVNSILEGTNAELIVGASNCDGEEITFEIYEQDTSFGDDLITPIELTNINSYSSSNDNGIWRAEYLDDTGAFDDGGDPEFYFIAKVTSSGEEKQSDVMTVLNSGACAGYNFCSELPQDLCGICDVGEASQPIGVTCGIGAVDSNGCYDTTSCFCVWNTNTNTCNAANSVTNTCPSSSLCGNGRLDAGEECDDTFLRLNDDSCTLFDAYTSGTVGCYAPGSAYECTYDFRNCVPQPVCGNGVREEGEECDPPLAGECALDCTDLIAGSQCGNGIVEPDETCDLGQMQLNLIGVDCSNFDAYSSGLVDCYAAGTTYECTYDFGNCAPQSCGNDVVEEGEECEPPSLNGCDASCMWDDGGTTSYEIGMCEYSGTADGTCGEGTTFITVTSTGTMNWDSSNDYPLSEIWGTVGVDFIEDPVGSGSYRYDPSDEYGECTGTTIHTIQCPALIELPFFGVYQLVLAIALVGLIYLIYVLRKKNSKASNSKSKKPVKKHKKK